VAFELFGTMSMSARIERVLIWPLKPPLVCLVTCPIADIGSLRVALAGDHPLRWRTVLGASGSREPAGPQWNGGPEQTAFLQRSDREEPPQAAGKKAERDGFGGDGNAHRFRPSSRGMSHGEAPGRSRTMPTGRCHHKDGGMKGAQQTIQFVSNTSCRIKDSMPIRKRDETGLNHSRSTPVMCGNVNFGQEQCSFARCTKYRSACHNTRPHCQSGEEDHRHHEKNPVGQAAKEKPARVSRGGFVSSKNGHEDKESAGGGQSPRT
jgi:hypothetical protein